MAVGAEQAVEPDDIGVIHMSLMEGYVAVRVSEVSGGRIVYPFVITEYTHSAPEDFEGFVRPDHEEYADLYQQITDAEDEGKMVALGEEDVERLTSESGDKT